MQRGANYQKKAPLGVFAACACLVWLGSLPVLAGSTQATLGIRLVILDSCEIDSNGQAAAEPVVSVTCSSPTPYAIRLSSSDTPILLNAAAGNSGNIASSGTHPDTAETLPVPVMAEDNSGPTAEQGLDPATRLTIYY
jgi:hypothetical protein